MVRVAALVSGGGTNLQAIIDSVEAGRITNASIEVVISNNKNAYALERAKNHGIAHMCISPKDYVAREEFNQELLKVLLSYKLDLIVLAGCMVVLPKELVEQYENRIINIHPALIPSFCGTGFYGLRVHEKALERGVKLTGATVHFVDSGTDTGPIIAQKCVEVLDDDTPQSLQKRVMEQAEWVILPQAIDDIANNRIEMRDNHVVRKDK